MRAIIARERAESSIMRVRSRSHTKQETTATFLNVTTQCVHELNDRVPLTLVKGRHVQIEDPDGSPIELF